jgi:TetR/AcrR family transcriptional regulator, repressor for neighboring sulfatase
MANEDKTSRGGREATTAAILAAAEGLFAEHGFTAVTVRDIAREAGVSHALVHRYLGTKEDIYRAVLSQDEGAILQAAPDNDDLLETASLMLREGLAHQRPYLRLIAHSALHGIPFETSSGRFAATERLVALAEEAAAGHGDAVSLDPRFVVAAVVALYLGWAATREWVVAAAGVRDMDEEALVDSLERVILDIFRAQLPGLDEAGGRET